MAITVVSYIVGNDLNQLQIAVAAAVTGGQQPLGSPTYLNGLFVQAVYTGSAQDSLTDMQTDIATNAEAIAAANSRTAITDYTANGAVSVNLGRKKISKTSAAAMTLAAPAADGVEMDIFAGTAFAHVITATGLIDDGVTGGGKNTITLGAFVGACVTIFGSNGHWVVKSKTVATIA